MLLKNYIAEKCYTRLRVIFPCILYLVFECELIHRNVNVMFLTAVFCKPSVRTEGDCFNQYIYSHH